MFVLGILLGFGTAVGQSFTYLFSRILAQRGWSMVRLIILSHIMMAAITMPLAIWLAHDQLATWRHWLWPLIGTTGFYIVGQAMFLTTLRFSQPSRLAPLLGLKIVILAIVATFWLNMTLSPVQWAGVLLATAAAFTLNYTGGANPPRTVVGVLITCVCYALSDTSIVKLTAGLTVGDDKLMAAIRAAAVAYVFCGLITLPLLFFIKPTWRDWKQALPYSLAWLGSMMCMFPAIALIGVVLANILQSLRGIVSIGLGVLVARAGHHHVEAHTTKSVLVRRLIAATMMTAAVGLYVWGKSKAA